ncbi:MAG: DUF423 domain-containing protein [Ignavibacteria bacterium]|nr:DUF423 domain-containing protein [Ignavibacteria bacterium]MBT8383358.1 DUF423 domain-containing protein [Ignavibacteria bacterium]MBT8390384.1 DUF423 domain-containing protein [Ignavibacteria bacterium]NNJ53356.1 DUF423 domain-containing protein [Ignavibacteriaceae bacterium]NNL21629.1 DUF423 domain-containing protein [Ignavibacteriaceae bacterium]
MKNNKTWIIIAGFSGFLGVALGAFGAHGLKDVLSSEMLETYKTGVFYHLIHAVAMLAIALSSKREFIKAAFFFFAGIVLFSFSLYIYSYTQVKVFAIVTPFGGVSFLIGWAFLIFEGIKRDKKK